MSLPAYRHLWRAARLAFKGDDRVLTAAKQQIRQGFKDQASLAPTNPAYGQAIQKAEDIARILRENVVQGKKEESHIYKLRIHEDTERGDNDSVKMAGSGKATTGGCGCS
ncbi:mitochondrial zinc maintenance protein [Colletotrichum tofieldiae]|uniref:Mitochondrial zinc maintenance protein 1, mitochondrial n=1 Tax=Colletotrichum tofieldiae TaxID=708197 RepID=A0A166NSC6_9PEZI|nr:mitochondrial zinc maintenance protein [Colletotrichum tofieldiae]GKT62182.1 mitochondrial zinc maintenance protein [Colletotrichum tofieldiae]GKT69770.1 mitochondrial zinc maintenance protein [Colletotrichum tofieldiae]GKT92783.1 mitochondrial zinc maintenance protein [Colletotrichum tofieldiae]